MIRASRRPRPSRRLLPLALALLGSLASPVARAHPASPRGAPRNERERKASGSPSIDRELEAAIRQSIRRGVGWLRSRQALDGSFVESYGMSYPLGETALACLTLAACGEPAQGEAQSRALAYLRRTHDGIEQRGGLGLTTYGVSLTLMAVIEAHQKRSAPLTGPAARRDRTTPVFDLPDQEREWAGRMTRWLIRNRNRRVGLWRYPRPEREYDHSNSQFAILALRAARQSGYDVSTRVFYEALQHLLTTLEQPGIRDANLHGGFGYQRGEPPTGGMTAAGVACLAACREQILGRHPSYSAALDQRVEAAIRSGLGWLARFFAVNQAPDPARVIPAKSRDLFHYYYLYTLERACGVSNVDQIGEHDWYAEGSSYLLARQETAGCWPGDGGSGAVEPSLANTCFSLLFLSRLSDPRGRLITPPVRFDLEAAASLDEAEFASAFETAFRVFAREGQKTLQPEDFKKMGYRAYSCLVDRLASRTGQERRAAIRALEELTGARLGYRADGPLVERRRAIEKWRQYIEFLD